MPTICCDYEAGESYQLPQLISVISLLNPGHRCWQDVRKRMITPAFSFAVAVDNGKPSYHDFLGMAIRHTRGRRAHAALKSALEAWFTEATHEALCEVAARHVNWSDAGPSISSSTLSDRFRL